MKIHGYASLPHYADHILPILRALPEEVRGTMWAPRPGLSWGPALPGPVEQPGPDWFITAGLADAQRIGMNHPQVYVEHGAGQTYLGLEDHGSYAGGNHTNCDVRLYLAPNETIADRWRARGADAAAVGCPWLDRWAGREWRPRADLGTAPVVVFTWHWKCELVPETFTAWPWYELAMDRIAEELRADGIVPVGHAHPRFAGQMARWYADHDWPYLATLAEVFDHGHVLVGDNTSALPEAAAAGLGVVWLNAPQYRRDVHHGGRFWDWPTGQPVADRPDEVVGAVQRALVDETLVAVRAAMVDRIYARPTGSAAITAAAAILEAMAR